MRRLALFVVAACGNPASPAAPRTLDFQPFGVPQYTSHDVFVGGDSNIVVTASRIFLTPTGQLVAAVSDSGRDMWRIYDDGGAGPLVATYNLTIAGAPIAATSLQSVAFDEDGYAYVAGGSPYVELWKSTKPLDAP